MSVKGAQASPSTAKYLARENALKYGGSPGHDKMPVPFNIDFMRFLGASFGQKWDGELDFGLLVERLGQQLGFSSDESREFLEAFAQKMITVVQPITTRQGMLRLYPTVKQANAEFSTWASENLTNSEIRARLESLETHFIRLFRVCGGYR